MKKTKKNTIILAVVTTLAVVGVFSGSVLAGNTAIKSKGVVQTSDGTVLFDASDLTTIDEMITQGKTQVAQALNDYPGEDLSTDSSALATFAQITGRINSLTTYSGDYYYDQTTEGADIDRYVKEGDAYYPCDAYGNKIADAEAFSGDVANLVNYTPMNDGNLSAGTAGYIDKTLILGSGSDNVNYRNLGYAEGYADAQDSVDNSTIVYEYHAHEGNPSTQGGCYTIPVYHTHISACYTTKSCGGSVSKKYKNSYCNGCGSINTSYTDRNCCAVHGCSFESPNSTWPSGCMHCYCPNNYICNSCGKDYGTSYTTTCNATTSVLSCGKTTDTIDRYNTSCGYTEGQIIGAYISFE